MDKEKATRTLAKELGDKLGRETIIEESYKDNLIKNASAVYQIENLFFLEFYENRFFIPDSSYGESSLTELVIKHNPSFTGANYFFLENVHIQGHKYGGNRSRFTVTPYALIGDKESAALRKLFYKNVHPEIVYAMSTFGIDNFIEFYKNYKEFSLGYLAITVPHAVLKEDLNVIEKFIDFATKLRYDKDEEVDSAHVFKQFDGVGSLNARLERLGISTLEPARPQSNYVHRKVISQVVKQLLDLKSVKVIKKHDNPLLDEFIDFVFSLPHEEQNIESNKLILKNSPNLDFITAVLSKEYSDGKYFKEYFEVLAKEVREKIVASLKILSDRKPLHDSFLWSKGFKDVNLDYMDMYKKDADIFIEYFSKRIPEEKKAIIRDIMGCDFINEEVANWLNQNEAELLREVGLNG